MNTRPRAQMIIARSLKVAATPEEEAQILKLYSDGMSFPDIGRKLGIDPEDAYAIWNDAKQRANRDRFKGDAPEKMPELHSKGESDKMKKQVEYFKLEATSIVVADILRATRQARKSQDPAKALEELDAQVTDMLNTLKSNMQHAKAAAEQEQRAAGFDPKKAASLLAAVKKTSKPDDRQAMSALLAQVKMAADPKKALILAVYKRMPVGNKHLRGGKHTIMFTGNSAQSYGVENYTSVDLEDLSLEDLQRAAKAVGAKL